MSRHRFTAMVVSSSPQRRVAMVARLRGLGAREVVEAASAAEARVRGRTEGAHDLCVVDASLPDSPVLPLLQDLRQVGWKRIVVLTGRDDPYAVRAALAAGVRGYVVIPESTGPAGATAVVPRSRQRTGTPDELSAREVEVLQLVSDGRSNKQVGEELGLSALTVKSHLARIARKLGTGDRAEMVALAMRSGLVR
ncbi:MAG: response regulator transcription factor [Actinomycetota bacterium]|nr:MAG: response regulator transcription factor [Actinomycetota bacterium]